MTTPGYVAITYTCGHSYEMPTDPRFNSRAYIRQERRRARRSRCETCIERDGVPCEQCGRLTKALYAGGEQHGPLKRVCFDCLPADSWQRTGAA